MGKRSDIKPLPDCQKLNELLDYDPRKGTIVWRESIGPCSEGSPAGNVGQHGYLVIGIEGIYYLAHRIIWKMMTGCEPEDQVDHRDNDRLNNKWFNLRPATNGPNIQNSRLRRDNKSGIKGVCWDSSNKKWVAQISLNRKNYRIGRYVSIDDAAKAIIAARKKFHGEFARYQ